MNLPTFRWTCSYMNSVYYELRDAAGTREIELRRRTCDYERSHYNGTEEDYERNCGALVGWLRDHRPIARETVAAFNAWVLAEKAREMAKLDAAPERYGVIAADDPMRQAHLAKGSALWVGGQDGHWQFEPVDADSQLAA